MNKELAIECIKTQRQFVDDRTREAFDMAIEVLEQSEKAHGKWIEVAPVKSEGLVIYDVYKCSCCGDTVTDCDSYDFCPWCGAEMDGEQE